MIEEFGDFWTIQGDLRCITTNGTLRNSGDAVMGKGIALQAKQRYDKMSKKRYDKIESALGRLINKYGNHVFYLGRGLISFPTKHNWKENSDIELIKRSAMELVSLINDKLPIKNKANKRILLTRPGCGNGGLNWAEVKPIIQTILRDDTFIVINEFDDRDMNKNITYGDVRTL